LGGFEVRHEQVRVRGLPPALDGLRIGHLTDVHVGEFIDTEYLVRAVDALDAQGVDLQVMTGDLIDDLSQLEPTMDALERCKASLGMVAILGNHEKWRSESRVVEAYARRAPNSRLRLLVDENLVLEHKGAPLRVVGVDYPMRKGTGRHRLPPEERNAVMRASAERAWTGVSPDELVLCLTHHPDFFPIAAERGARLTLAGHTHGGQVGLWRIPLFGFAYEHMLGRYQRGEAHLYVGAGTGHWMPFRVGIPAEVTVLTLRSA
ncbi:MAG: metallophosphoesterase, partial [Myxococcaceae bacterium]